jgi:hypothetical protein
MLQAKNPAFSAGSTAIMHILQLNCLIGMVTLPVMSESVRGLLFLVLMLLAAIAIIEGVSSVLQDRAEDIKADDATSPPR